jgi:ribonuclease P protein component
MRKLLWKSIKASWEFKKVTQLGTKVHTNFFIFFNLPSSQFKLGVVASKKVGNAVARNRAKRIMRSVFSEICKNDSSTTVLIAKQEILRANYIEVKTSLVKALTKGKSITIR